MKKNFLVVALGLLVVVFAVKLMVGHFLFHHPLNFIPRSGDFMLVMIALLNAYIITQNKNKAKLS
jgi:hypothetical protein